MTFAIVAVSETLNNSERQLQYMHASIETNQMDQLVACMKADNLTPYVTVEDSFFDNNQMLFVHEPTQTCIELEFEPYSPQEYALINITIYQVIDPYLANSYKAILARCCTVNKLIFKPNTLDLFCMDTLLEKMIVKDRYRRLTLEEYNQYYSTS